MSISEMIWCGLHRALQLEQVVDHRLGDRARALVAEDRDAVDLGDVDRVAGRVLADVAGGGADAVAALERGDRQPEAAGRRGTRASPGRGGRSGRCGCRRGRTRRSRCRGSASTRRSSCAFDISRTWPTLAASGRTGSCRRRGRSRSPRAASSRRGSASGRSAARRLPAGRIAKWRCGASPSSAWPISPRTVPATTFEPLRSGCASIVLRSNWSTPAK